MTWLVTGANGFIGSAFCKAALHHHAVRAALRESSFTDSATYLSEIESVRVPSLDANADWTHALQGCEVVVHAAARVHMTKDTSTNPLAEYRRINTQGTLALAQQAARMGIKRFVFISSVKVMGEATSVGHAWTPEDVPGPTDPYGISKLEAEQQLTALSQATGMELVVVRPPLVYGPGVKANFAAMVSAVRRGLPLPLGAVRHNRRSLVALDNLVDLLLKCTELPQAAGQCFHVSDGEDLSTAELLERIGQAVGRKARLWNVPINFLKFGAYAMGRADVFEKLCGSLQVDISKTREVLDWDPPLSVDEGLRQAISV